MLSRRSPKDELGVRWKGVQGPGLRVSEADLLPGTAGAPVSPSHCSDEG